MSITLVGMGEGAAINGGDVTLALPAMQEGDTVYVWGGHANTGTGLGPSTAGYTLIASNTANATVKGGVWRKRMGASPDADVVCRGGGNALDGVAYGFYVLRGVDATTPEDAAPTTATATGVNPNNPAITTVTNGAWVLALVVKGDDDSTFTEPTGYSNKIDLAIDDSNDHAIGGATIEKVTAGVEDPPAWADWAGTDRWIAFTVAVRPAAGVTVGKGLISSNLLERRGLVA